MERLESSQTEIMLSFIVPAYNCEKYIKECIGSLLKQNYPPQLPLISNYEIVIVNDGSTDGTKGIIESLAAGNKNIIVINQENKGRHEARNIGAAKARGRYIWFIDNDDVVCSNCLASIIETMETLSLDVLAVAPPAHFVPDFPEAFEIAKDVSTPVSGKEFMKHLCYWAPWEFVMRRSFYEEHNFKFELRYFLEDVEIMFRIFYFAGRVAAFKDFSCYSYIHRPESETMQPWTPNKVLDYARYLNLVESFVQDNVVEQEIKDQLEAMRTSFFLDGLKNLKSLNGQLDFDHWMSLIRKKPRVLRGTLIQKAYRYLATRYTRFFFNHIA